MASSTFHSPATLNAMSDFSDFLDFEFDSLGATTVTLPASAVAWAAQVSQQQPDAVYLWPTFLRSLALQGFQQWLTAGAQGLDVSYDPTRPPDPGVNCWVGDYRLCLVAQGSLSDELIAIAPDTLEDASHFAHLYILAEVQEEADRVTILSGLRRDRLLAHQQQTGLTLNADGTYAVPVHCFGSSPEDLLLYLSCLNPVQLNGVEPVSAAQAALTPAQPQEPRWATSPPINAGRWLRDQLDAVADSLALTLLPPLAPAHALMSVSTPVEQLEGLLRDLEPSGLTIPSTARGIYDDLQRLGLPMRFYTLIWTLFESPTPEWSLVLFLGPAPGEQLPLGTRLIVRDATSTLADQTPAPGHEADYLYAQAIGTWDEQFAVTVELPNGSVLDWSFSFNPEV